MSHTLETYLSDNPEGYDVDKYGLIRDLGPFQGEPLYVPFFYDLVLNGAQSGTVDHADGSVTDYFNLCDDERTALGPEYASDAILTIRVSNSGFVSSETATQEEFDRWEAEQASECAEPDELDEPDEPDTDEPDEPNEPDEGDYILSDSGPLGSRTSVGVYPGRHVGEFDSTEDAEDAVRAEAHKEQFWPDVWFVSDHGNATCYGTDGWRMFSCEPTWTVLVGNVGTVGSYFTESEARNAFETYSEQSEEGYGRAAGETVTLFRGEDIIETTEATEPMEDSDATEAI